MKKPRYINAMHLTRHAHFPGVFVGCGLKNRAFLRFPTNLKLSPKLIIEKKQIEYIHYPYFI